MKTSLSSVELAAMIHELQLLVNGRIDQIYQPEKKELIISIHLPNRGKQLLRILVGAAIYLVTEKTEAEQPTGFCMQLRKHIAGGVVTRISQAQSERIVEIEVTSHGKHFLLLFELFSKGNILLLDTAKKMIACLEAQHWATRDLHVGATYRFPPAAFDWLHATAEECIMMLEKSKKDSLVIALATDIGLSGLYAEEVCLQAKADKSRKCAEVSSSEMKKVIESIILLRKKIQNPKGILYTTATASEAAPVELLFYENQSAEKMEFSSFSAAINEALRHTQESKPAKAYAEKLKKLRHILEEQELKVNELEQEIQENTRRGEVMYEHYQELQEILDIAKKKKWNEIKEILLENKKVKEVDMKEKKVVVEI